MSGTLIRAPGGMDEGLDLTLPAIPASKASRLLSSLLRQEPESGLHGRDARFVLPAARA